MIMDRSLCAVLGSGMSRKVHRAQYAPRAVMDSVAHHGRPVALCKPSMSLTAPLVVSHSLPVASSSDAVIRLRDAVP